MGHPTRGGWAGAVRSITTGEAQDLASRNVPVASTGTALTPNMTATVTPTAHIGKLNYCVKSSAGAQTLCNVLIYYLKVSVWN